MNAYINAIEDLRAHLVGRKVIYPASIDGNVYTVVGVGCDGTLRVALPNESIAPMELTDGYWVVDKKDEDTDPFRAFRPQKPHPALTCHDVPCDYLKEW